MFDDRKAVEDAILNTAGAPALYDKLEKGEVPPGVISREPDRFIDIKKTFYILPIIDFVPLKEADGVDARLLQVAAAVPNRRARPEEVCTTDRRDFRDCIRAAGGRTGESLLIDVVYVVDLTGSMQPFVDATADSIRESAQKFSDVAGAEERIKFGLIGFRDSTDRWPENEFVTKNFTPNLVNRRQFEALLRNAVAKEGGDVPEAVYAGVEEGLKSKWTEKSVKLVVLVGDASSHESDDPLATSKYSAVELRRFADDKGVNVAAIYIKNPRQQADWAAGTDQFKTLATNPGGTIAFFASEPSPEAIKQTVFEGTALMIERLRDLSTGAEGEAAGATLANPLSAALEGGLVVYLGSGAEPPRDITGWMSDRDLSNPALRALDVNVLVTRSEIDTLTSMLDALVQSYRAQEATGQSWFQNLRNMPLMAAVGQIQLKDALARSPIVPKWIAGLPYRSDILSLTFEEFESLGGSERQQMIERIDGMIRTYKLFMAGDGWVALQPGDPPSDHVFPLPLSTLP
jgi:serine/threonine-protein kinase PpkA